MNLDDIDAYKLDVTITKKETPKRTEREEEDLIEQIKLYIPQ